MGQIPEGYSITRTKYIETNKWYALDLRKPHHPHVIPLICDNYHFAKRWIISQKFYTDNQVQLIKGKRVLEMGLKINWYNLPAFAMPHKYPGHLGFGNTKKDWKTAIRKELKASEEGWKRIRQFNFHCFGIQYVIYSWDKERSGHVRRIIKAVFPDKYKTIFKRLREGPKLLKPKTRWLSGIQRNPSPIMINRFNKENNLPPLDRFPYDGNIAMRWKGFIEEYAPLSDKYLKPIK